MTSTQHFPTDDSTNLSANPSVVSTAANDFEVSGVGGPDSSRPDAALQSTVATIVARLRRNSGMTVDDLAMATGVPARILKDVESGRATPSLRALWALARVFEVPFRLLLAGPRFQDKGFHVLRRDGGRTVVSDAGRFLSRSLCAAGDPREPEVYEITLAPGCVELAAAHPPDTFEHIVVLQGWLRVRAGEADVTLSVGDTLFFGADVAHSYENAGPGESVALLTMTNGGDWVVG